MRSRFKGIVEKIFATERTTHGVYCCHLWITQPGYDGDEVKARPQTYKVELVQKDEEAIDEILRDIKPGDSVEANCWINSKPVYKNGIVDYNAFVRLKSIEKMNGHV